MLPQLIWLMNIQILDIVHLIHFPKKSLRVFSVLNISPSKLQVIFDMLDTV